MSLARRLQSIVLTVGLVAGAMAIGPAPAGACGAAMETQPLETFDVSVKVKAKAYKVGQTAKFKISIVRPAKNDPAGLGLPMPDEVPREAAADVNVGVGLRAGDVFLFGLGNTDENGKTTIGVELKNYTSRGVVARADIFAYKNFAETSCVTVQEYGYTVMPEAFKVRK